MKKLLYRSFVLLTIAGLGISGMFALSGFKTKEKVKIGFLIHDLVTDRWKADIANFTNKVEELGGEVTVRNAYGDAKTQIIQGKLMIDGGIKVIAVVAQNGKALAELVDYANKAGTTIIAYDRMILNCDLPYYISFNSVKVGEMMAEYALKLKPRGNYILINGPASDNNALLIRKGVMNKLKDPIAKGLIKVLLEKESDSWFSLGSLMIMSDFLATNKQPVDAVIAANDQLASGSLDAIKAQKIPIPVITGQDATVEGCKNVIMGNQSMTVFKSIKKLSTEAAILSTKLANGEKIPVPTATVNNGKRDVPSILFDPIVIDKNNLRDVLVSEGHIKDTDLK